MKWDPIEGDEERFKFIDDGRTAVLIQGLSIHFPNGDFSSCFVERENVAEIDFAQMETDKPFNESDAEIALSYGFYALFYYEAKILKMDKSSW